MNILAIETSSDACSCALRIASATFERHEIAPRQHTQLLLAMVEDVLREGALTLREVDLFAYGCGPGSFTGVRIAACAVQAMALAMQRPVLPISSLAAVAMRGAGGGGREKVSGGREKEDCGREDGDEARVIAAFDARLGEVYLGAYAITAQNASLIGAEQLATPDAVDLPQGDGWIGVGAGWAAHGEVLAARMGVRLQTVLPQVLPGAAQVARLAAVRPQAGVAAASALPGYLRREVATPRTGSLKT